MKNPKGNRDWADSIAIVMQLGLTMAGCIVFCFFVGRYLDGVFNTRGIFITIFTVLGVLGGANVAYRQIMELFETDKKGKDTRNDHGN